MGFHGSCHQAFIALQCILTKAPIFGPTVHPCCSGIQILLEGFEKWLDLENAGVDLTQDAIVVRYPRGGPHSFRLDKGEVAVSTEVSSSGEDTRAATTLRQHGVLTYSFEEPITFDEAKEQAGLIADLLILLTDSDRSLPQPRIQIVGQDGWHQYHFTRREPAETGSAEDGHWATFPQIRPNFGSIFASWFAKHFRFGPGFHLYLGTRRGSHLYIEHRFVNLVWGLESLHRRSIPPRPNTKIEAKIKRILESIAIRKDRVWLERRLEHDAEPSLAERMVELFVGLPLNLNLAEVTSFARNCAEKRNDVSHVGGHREPGTYREWVLGVITLNNALDPLYHACILREIGVPDQLLRERFLHPHYGFHLRQTPQAVGLNLPPA